MSEHSHNPGSGPRGSGEFDPPVRPIGDSDPHSPNSAPQQPHGIPHGEPGGGHASFGPTDSGDRSWGASGDPSQGPAAGGDPSAAGGDSDPHSADPDSSGAPTDPHQAPVPHRQPLGPRDPGAFPLGGQPGSVIPAAAPVRPRAPHAAPSAAGAPAPAGLPPVAPGPPPRPQRPTPPPTPNRQRTPSTPNQQPRRRFGTGAIALAAAGAVLAGGLAWEMADNGVSRTASNVSKEVGSWFADDDQEAKPNQETNPGGPIFTPNQEKSNELFVGKNVYDWANGFNLTADNVDQAKNHMYEVAYYDAGIAAAQLSTAGFDGLEGVNAAPDKNAFSSDAELQTAVLGYEDYLRGNTEAAEKALNWFKNDYLAKANVHVENHSGNYKTWGKDLNGKVYIEDSAWGDSAVLVCEMDGQKTFYRADCGWQPYEQIAVQVTYASQVFQPAAATSVPTYEAAAPQGQDTVVYAAQWGPQGGDTPPPAGDTPPTDVPSTNTPPTNTPPTVPPSLMPKTGPDANAVLTDAIDRLGDLAGQVKPGLPKPAVDPPAKYDAPAAPKFNGTIPGADSNPRSGGGGGASVPSVDPGLKNGPTPNTGTVDL